MEACIWVRVHALKGLEDLKGKGSLCNYILVSRIKKLKTEFKLASN